MIRKIQTGYQLWRHFGTTWLVFRFYYAWQHRTGALKRRLPLSTWQEQPLATFLIDRSLGDVDRYLQLRRQHTPTFFFNASQQYHYAALLQQWDDQGCCTPRQLAEEIAAGKLRYFGQQGVDVGLPPSWNRNPFTGQEAPTDRHWSEIADFGFGDIKAIWEASRFGFAYALVRAYWRTGDERYPELFWRLLEDWRAHNPPQHGANWKCGQETSLRVMAWIFALYGFLQAESTTAERVAQLAQMIAVSGRRIEANLTYALSQRNNHGISEGMGLWTIGLLFPEFGEAGRWRKTGRAVLEQLGRELIYDDGAFVQHSVNYQRLMLHDYLWAIRLGDLNHERLSEELRQRVAKAAHFLYQLQDEGSGQLPVYGQQDGALILALNNCEFWDFRPVIQATHYLTNGQRCYDAGAWDEDLLWLFGPSAVQAQVSYRPRQDFAAEVGGYYTLRSSTGFAFTRCATFRDRPGQADMLHVDLWWRGCNIALDAGTYSYNAPDPWNNSFAHSQFHNVVTVDGQEQMGLAAKFLWLPWLHSKTHDWQHLQETHFHYWEGEHDGYQRLASPVTHRRGILQIDDETWLVIDHLQGTKPHHYRLHWLLADYPYTFEPTTNQLSLLSPKGEYHLQVHCLTQKVAGNVVRACPTTARGWRASAYATRQPALSLEWQIEASSVTFVSIFSAQPCNCAEQENLLHLAVGDKRLDINVASEPNQSLLQKLTCQIGQTTSLSTSMKNLVGSAS